MPTNTPGFSFAPTFENAQMAQQQGRSSAAPQSAIETLNFRLPTQVSQASVSPLVGQGMVGSNFGGAVLQSVLRTVLGAEAARAFDTPDNNGRDQGAEIFRILAGLGGGGGLTSQPSAPSAPMPQMPNAPSTPAFSGPAYDPYSGLPPMSPQERAAGRYLGDTSPIRDDYGDAEDYAASRSHTGDFWDLMNDYVFKQEQKQQSPKNNLPANFIVENEQDANWGGGQWWNA